MCLRLTSQYVYECSVFDYQLNLIKKKSLSQWGALHHNEDSYGNKEVLKEKRAQPLRTEKESQRGGEKHQVYLRETTISVSLNLWRRFLSACLSLQISVVTHMCHLLTPPPLISTFQAVSVPFITVRARDYFCTRDSNSDT